MSITMSASRTSPTTRAVRPTVLIVCADDRVEVDLIRELAGRDYQPLVGRPDWSWRATLEWARPVAAVVDRRHPAARSAGFLADSKDLDVGVVIFGRPDDSSGARREDARRAPLAMVPTVNIAQIGGAVDDTVRKLKP